MEEGLQQVIIIIVSTRHCDRRLSVCHTRAPAKAVGRNANGRKTRVVPGNIVLDRGPDPPRGREICVFGLGIEPHS